MRSLTAAAAVALSISLSAQTPEKRTFEVASIKPHPTSESVYSIGPAVDRFVATNVTLRQLVQFAVRPIPARVYIDSQITGGPGWITTDHFDVQAKADSGGRPVPFEDLRQMTESLLEERFHLKTHREKREMPVYALVRLGSGVKMKLSPTQEIPKRDGLRVFNPNAPQPLGSLIMLPARPGDATLAFSGSAAAMPMLVNVLQGFVDRLVVDETNLTTLFDFRLEFSRPSAPGVNAGAPTDLSATPDGGAQLFTAVQEQLGLKLEPKKSAAEVLIIDGAEHPTEN